MKIQDGDILIFDEKPDTVEFDQPGIVVGVTEYSYGGGLAIVELPTRPDDISSTYLFFERDDEATNGINSWDLTYEWKVGSVWRPSSQKS